MINLIIFAAPLLLLIIIGILIRTRGSPETSGRRYFLFLVWTSIGSLVLILLNWIIPLPWLDFAIILFPIVPGLIVLSLLYWREWDSLSRRTQILILCVFGILLAATIGQLVIVSSQGVARQFEPIFFGMSLLSVSAFIFIVWKWGKRYPLVLFLITILYLTFFLTFDLAGLSLPSETMSGWMNMLGRWHIWQFRA